MSDNDLLIFIPTYKERENVRLIVEGLRYNLGPVPILFCDDNSPDGTYDAIMDLAREDGAIDVIRRPGKLGIGSAHKDGIREAARRGYETLVKEYPKSPLRGLAESHAATLARPATAAWYDWFAKDAKPTTTPAAEPTASGTATPAG